MPGPATPHIRSTERAKGPARTCTDRPTCTDVLGVICLPSVRGGDACWGASSLSSSHLLSNRKPIPARASDGRVPPPLNAPVSAAGTTQRLAVLRAVAAPAHAGGTGSRADNHFRTSRTRRDGRPTHGRTAHLLTARFFLLLGPRSLCAGRGHTPLAGMSEHEPDLEHGAGCGRMGLGDVV